MQTGYYVKVEAAAKGMEKEAIVLRPEDLPRMIDTYFDTILENLLLKQAVNIEISIRPIEIYMGIPAETYDTEEELYVGD